MKLSNQIHVDHEDIDSIHPSEDRKSLLGLHTSGLVKIWQIKKSKLVHEFQIPMNELKKGIKHLKYFSEAQLLIFGDYQKLILWDLGSEKLIKEIKAPKSKGIIDFFNCISIDLPHERLFVGGSEKLRIVELYTGKNIQSTRRKPMSPPYYGNYTHSQITDDHKHLLAIRKLYDKTGQKESIEIWDVSKNRRIHEISRNAS